MRERDINRQMFHAGHYNVIAGRLRRGLEPYFNAKVELEGMEKGFLLTRTALVNLCLEFAYRLQADNEDFDPIRFLKMCSPNEEMYPLHELWDIDNYNHSIKVEVD